MRQLTIPTLTGLAALLAAQASSAQISFKPAVSVRTPAQPDASALLDLDGDGDLDLAVATDAPDKVTLQFNAGGSFGAPVQVFLAGGTGPHTPVGGDLDSDGDVDLAVSLKNTDQVQILVNNNGSFVPGPVFAVGAEPRSMAIGDVDGDGDWDLAVSNRSGNSISVLRNQGALSFSVSSVAVGAEPRELAFGELTGDKLPDLAVAVHDDRLVRVVVNQGAGGFVAGAALPLGQLRPQGLDSADIDADGDGDIVASASNNGVEFASVILNLGAGSFSAPTSYPLAGQDASSLVLSDLDGDGALDVATANTDSNNVSTLRNNGNGTFGPASLFAVGTEPGHVVAADLDGNGSADVVATNDVSGDVSVLFNQNSGTPCSAMAYCTAKTNSQGVKPQIVATGVPSFGAQGFSVAMTGAVPNNVTIAIWGQSGPGNLPFAGGTICVQPPLRRLPARVLGANGAISHAIPITAAMAGTTRWYQFWYRDPAHPDGTGVGLSNGLAVTFCD